MMEIEWSSFIVIAVSPLLWMNRLIESSKKKKKMKNLRGMRKNNM
jgi:hypothetical protein